MKRDEYRKAEFFLYNYLKTDELIKEVEEEIIDDINVSGSTWIKGITSYNNTLENQIIRLIENKRIIELKRWQVLIKNVLVFLKRNRPLYFELLKLKYLEQKSDKEIQKTFKIDFKRFKIINYKLVGFIIKNAKLRNLI